MILGRKTTPFLQNHFRMRMAKFREFGITRPMMFSFVNSKDNLSKCIFQGHLSNTENSHLQDDVAKSEFQTLLRITFNIQTVCY